MGRVLSKSVEHKSKHQSNEGRHDISDDTVQPKFIEQKYEHQSNEGRLDLSDDTVQPKFIDQKYEHQSNEGRLDLSDDAYSAFSEIPDGILYEVFLRLQASDLKTCYLVCKRFAGLLSCQGIWKQKCQQVFSKKLLQFLKDEEDYRKLYFKRPYERNLIKNCDASQGMEHWILNFHGPFGWPDEHNPEEIEYLCKLSAPDVPFSFWSTDLGTFCKSQIVDLLEEGCSEYVLDVVRPSIRASEWYSSKTGGGERYTLEVWLMREREEMWEKSPPTPEQCVYKFSREVHDEYGASRWFKAGHVFKNYPAGVRYIGFIHQGRLVEGFYNYCGINFTLSTVVLDFTHTQLQLSESEPPNESPVSSSLN